MGMDCFAMILNALLSFHLTFSAIFCKTTNAINAPIICKTKPNPNPSNLKINPSKLEMYCVKVNSAISTAIHTKTGIFLTRLVPYCLSLKPIKNSGKYAHAKIKARAPNEMHVPFDLCNLLYFIFK